MLGPRLRIYTPFNMEIGFTVGEVVRDQAETMSTCKYSLVTGLLNQKSSVSKTSVHLSSHSPLQVVNTAHSTSSKGKFNDENNLNVVNKTIDQIVTEKESTPSTWSTPCWKI